MTLKFPPSSYPNPPYVYHPFPAWVTLTDGRYLIVESQAERDALEAEIARNKRPVLTLPKKG